MKSVKDKLTKDVAGLKKLMGIDNVMALPKLLKVIVSTGIGSLKDKKKIELVTDRLVKITGQKPSVRGAKKSVASFKVRQGDPVGLMTTLRGDRMYGFLEKLINVAIPRIRDFRGLELRSIDKMGNYTIGLKEHTVFPETADEDLRDVFGLAITINTTAKNKKEAEELLRYIGMPIKKA
ncbi:MAG: 50S ribosomal protein L5 [Candidatus Vogelbacteria bacterium]|nr:50S ribosomal protein L5 [Candidatus Vogelbacteria bacterium]